MVQGFAFFEKHSLPIVAGIIMVMHPWGTVAGETAHPASPPSAAPVFTGNDVDEAYENASVDLLSEDEYLDELPLVLSVTRLVQPKRDSPAAVTVIDRDMIQASGIRKLPELFRLVPGMQVSFLNGHWGVVAYHGMSDQFPRRMQVLVDGRSVFGPLSGGVFWADLPLAVEDIERIEVIRGPNAATFGSSAFFGVINISTRHASQDQGQTAKITMGNPGIKDGLYRYGWQSGHGAYRLTVGYRSDDGLANRPDTETTPYATFRGDLPLWSQSVLEIKAGVSGGKRLEGMADDVIFPKHTADNLSHYSQLRWRHTINPQEEIALQFHHQYRHNDEPYLTEPVPVQGETVQIPVDNSSTEQRIDFDLQHRMQAFTNWRLVWGAGLRLDRVKAPIWFNKNDFEDNKIYHLFSNAEWHALPNVVINMGAMLEKTDLTQTTLSPRLALNYHVNVDHTVRIGVSTATRNAVLIEEMGQLNYTFNGLLLDQVWSARGGLEPEKLTTYEAALLGKYNPWNLSWDLRLYREHMRDIVTEIRIPFDDELIPEKEAFNFVNTGEFVVQGAELEITYQPTRRTRLIATAANMRGAGSSYNQNLDIVVDGSDLEKSIPRYSAGLLAIQQINSQWRGALAFYTADEMRWIGDGDDVDNLQRMDLSLTRILTHQNGQGSVSLVAQLPLYHYDTFVEDNIVNRRFFIASQWRW